MYSRLTNQTITGVAYFAPSTTNTHLHCCLILINLWLHSTENEEVALPMGERASDAANTDAQKSVLFGDGAKLDAPLTLWTIPG